MGHGPDQHHPAAVSARHRAPELFDIGTEAPIVDFNPLNNGRLGITVKGRRKFRVRSVTEQEDHLLIGQVAFLPEEPQMPVGQEHQELVDLLSELLPIEAEIKQSLLQLQLPRERLQELTRLVSKLRG